MLDLLPLPLQTRTQSGGPRRAVPLAHLLKLGLYISWQRHAKAIARQQSFDSMDHARPIALRGQEFPVPLAAVRIDPAGDPDHTPDLLFPSRMTQPHGEELVHLQALRFRPAVAAVHLTTGCVDHEVLDALAESKPGEPQPLA